MIALSSAGVTADPKTISNKPISVLSDVSSETVVVSSVVVVVSVELPIIPMEIASSASSSIAHLDLTEACA